jgi:RNA polymerase sigma factor (sigma-70 family)
MTRPRNSNTTVTPVRPTSPSSDDRAARFARDAEPHFDVLSRGARRLTRNIADAEDLLQDTLLHAFAGLNTFEEGSNLKAWLFRILYNRWVSTYRVKQRRPSEISVDDVSERDLTCSASRLVAGLRSAEAEVLDELADSEIQEALAALPEGFRTALYFSEVQGFTFAETAALLNIPIGTAMSRVSRGRQRLRTALAHLNVHQGERADLEPCIA